MFLTLLRQKELRVVELEGRGGRGGGAKVQDCGLLSAEANSLEGRVNCNGRIHSHIRGDEMHVVVCVPVCMHECMSARGASAGHPVIVASIRRACKHQI